MPEKNTGKSETSKPETAFTIEQQRRLEAAHEARQMLTMTGFRLSGGPTSEEPIIALAEWILNGLPEDNKADEDGGEFQLPNEFWCESCGKAHSIEKLPDAARRLLEDLMEGLDLGGIFGGSSKPGKDH
jgi:hypothetical protein